MTAGCILPNGLLGLASPTELSATVCSSTAVRKLLEKKTTDREFRDGKGEEGEGKGPSLVSSPLTSGFVQGCWCSVIRMTPERQPTSIMTIPLEIDALQNQPREGNWEKGETAWAPTTLD